MWPTLATPTMFWLSISFLLAVLPGSRSLRLRMSTANDPVAVRFREEATGGESHSSRVVEVREHEALWHGLKIRDIGGSGLRLSELGLGTMMWGSQVNEEEAAAQLTMALDKYGMNWLDTAEMYPVPAVPETATQTESMIGRLLQGRPRDSYCLATKVCGRSKMGWMREGGEDTAVTPGQLKAAVEGSLKRLQTDYIDLLQLHWPDRYVPLYGEASYDQRLEIDNAVPFLEQLQALDELVREGKVKHVGLSNETPYGVTSFAALSAAHGLVKPVSVQQGYNLLNRNDFETGMVEACSVRHCDMGLLVYSPLAGGALSGKYILKDDDRLMQARLHQFPGFFSRYNNDLSRQTIAEYRLVASDFGVTLAQLSMAFCATRPFVSSTIVGATSVEQLEENILSLNVPINEETLEKLDNIYLETRDPSKILSYNV